MLDAFERAQVQRSQRDYFENLKIFEALYKEAMHLEILPSKDPLEGIDVDIRLATVLNVRTSP